MITKSRKSRKQRVRSKLEGSASRPRVSVYRSNKYMSVQLIDDQKGQTLLSVHEKELKKAKGTKTEKAGLIGVALAEKALKAGIKKVVFDRSGYKYHGRVKAVAENMRAKGLEL